MQERRRASVAPRNVNQSETSSSGRARCQVTSATLLGSTQSESTRAGGGFPARAPTSRSSRCFAFGLDTETEINDGRRFLLFHSSKTANNFNLFVCSGACYCDSGTVKAYRPSKLSR